MPQLSLQHTWPTLQVLRPHITLADMFGGFATMSVPLAAAAPAAPLAPADPLAAAVAPRHPFTNAAAAVSCTRLGALAGVPSLVDVETMLARG